MSQKIDEKNIQSTDSKIQRKWFSLGTIIGCLLTLAIGHALHAGTYRVSSIFLQMDVMKEITGHDGLQDNLVSEVMKQINQIQNAADIILVNKEHALPESYNVSLVSLDNGIQVSEVIYEDLCRMLADGQKQEKGTSFLVVSGYRTREKQADLLEKEIQKNMWMGMDLNEAREDALLTVAPAGYSEHETGLAVDIVASTNQMLDETQEQTRENKWLQQNCYKYGFILRYPRGERASTGFSYESWHFRYVGKEVAKEITEKEFTLEKYLEEESRK